MGRTHNFLEEEKIGKLLLKFSFPAVVGMLVNALYNIVDRIYIGHIDKVGHLAIAGVGIVFPIMLLSFAFALLVGLGSASNISLNLGRKNTRRAEKFLGNSVVLGTIFAFVFTVIVFMFMKKLIYLVGGSDITYHYAKDYLQIIAIGFWPLTLGFILNAAIRSDGHPKMAMMTLLVGALVNVILDPILIFVFDMGVRGAGVATLMSQITSFVWTVYYFRSSKSKIKLHWKNLYLRWNLTKKTLALGGASFAVQIGVSVINYIMNVILREYGGDISIGAMAIIQAIMSLLLMPIFGINQGSQPIIGYNYGAKRYDRVQEALWKAIFAASCICLLGFVSVEVFSLYCVKLFTTDAQLISLASYGLRIQVLCFLLVGFQIISASYFQVIGKPKISFFLSMSRQILVLIPCLFILSHFWGLDGLWFAAPVSDAIAFLLTMTLIRREWKHLEYLRIEREHELLRKQEEETR